MKRTVIAAGVALTLSAGALVAWASSPGAWDELKKRAEAACMAASGLHEPSIAAPVTNFEHHVFAVVDGTWPDGSAMAGETAQWACLYDKEHETAEAREPGFP